MGSFLSGRYGKRTSRGTTDDYYVLDVRFLSRESLLVPGTFFTLTWTQRREPAVTENFAVGASGLTIGRATVGLEWWRCPLGGHRPWLLCPSCGGRACLLYRAPGGYACRRCLKLAWPVERENREDRRHRKANKVISRSKMDSSRKYGKPRWMRWPTFRKQEEAAEAAGEVIAERHDRLIDRIEAIDAWTPKRRGRPAKAGNS